MVAPRTTEVTSASKVNTISVPVANDTALVKDHGRGNRLAVIVPLTLLGGNMAGAVGCDRAAIKVRRSITKYKVDSCQ